MENKNVLHIRPGLLNILDLARKAGEFAKDIRLLPFEDLQTFDDYLIDFGDAHTDDSLDHKLWMQVKDAMADQLKAKGEDVRRLAFEKEGDIDSRLLAGKITENIRGKIALSQRGQQWLN
ncbi:hypothetical protein KBD59_03935 [Candidatus Gracilibacteria bacterium]|nr:hypothetical protein [Candidatus Gracilibacteria bacterium]